MFTLTEDRQFVEQCGFEKAAGHGKAFKKLRYLMFHYTAGRSYESSLSYFKSTSNVSAHFLIGRKGQLVQMVQLDQPAWHAGKDSKWKVDRQFLIGDEGLNFFSLGIELDNHGPLTFSQDKTFRTWYGALVDPADVVEVEPSAPGSFGKRFWHRFTEEQIEIVSDLATTLCREFGLVDVIGHSDACPGRKQDPGPAFPLAHIHSLVFGRE